VLVVAVLLDRDLVRRRRAVSESVSLSQIPASIQRRFHIHGPSWEGSLAMCTPPALGAVSLCDLTDGSIRAVRTPASGRERSTLAFLSPDGQLIAYIWIVDPTFVSLRLIHADGSNDRELLPPSEPMVSLIGWNRASNAILIATADGNGACIELLEVGTGARQKLRCVTDRTSLGSAALSPDDRYLAYTKQGSMGGRAEDIWILDRVNRTDRAVTTGAAMDFNPLWTPDGKGLTFVSDRFGTWGLFLIIVENGLPQGSPELVRDLGRSMPAPLGFRRDGTLFLRTMTDLEDVLRTDVDLSASSLGSPGRAEPTALDESNRSPDWSPDGQRFAYIAGAWRGEARIVIARARGGVEKPLSFPGMPSALGKVRWSPDGRMLAVTVGLPGRDPTSGLDLVDSDTGQRHRVLATARIVDLRWAPDGNSIYFLSAGAIWSVDLTSAICHEVYRPEKPWMIDRFATFDLSRDGKAFVVAIRSPGVVHCAARIITTAGEVRDLPPFTSECRAIAWTHDEQAVLAGVGVDDGSIPVFTVPVHGGAEPVRLQSPRLQVVDISVSPDGRELLLGSGNPRPDVWTLSGFTSHVK
jgi:Tol biopolymer transport system component